MDGNADFSEFGTIVDEFFAYPGTVPVMEEYAIGNTVEIAPSPLRDFGMEFDDFTSVPPSLSRSSSRSSHTAPSPVINAPPRVLSHMSPVEMKTHWQNEGQIQFQKPITKKSFQTYQEKSAAASSSPSSPGSNEGDEHHEGSCAKCRMTEAEARRYRLQRRREQNRASQRKFRARKEAKIREAASQVATLETYVEFLEKHNSDLEKTNARLRQKLTEVEQHQEGSTDKPTNSTMRRAVMKTPHRQSVSVTGSGPVASVSSTTWAHPSKTDIGGLYLPLFDHELHPKQANSIVTPVAP